MLFFAIALLFFEKPMISVHAKNFTLVDSDKEKIEEKAAKLLHLAKDMSDESTRIRIEFELIAPRKDLILGTLTITLPHHDVLRAEAKEEKNVLTVMDKLENEIRPQIERHKNKHKH